LLQNKTTILKITHLNSQLQILSIFILNKRIVVNEQENKEDHKSEEEAPDTTPINIEVNEIGLGQSQM